MFVNSYLHSFKTKLQNILNQAKAFSTSAIRSDMIAYILNQNTLVKHNFDIAGTLIDYANSVIEYYFEYGIDTNNNLMPY